MIQIPLTQSKFATVDDEDADLALFKWSAKQGRRTYYAHHEIRVGSKKTTETLHRVIGKRLGIIGFVDHEDRDGLNCQRVNLRPATSLQNSCNRPKQNNNTSGYIGVTWYKPSSQWRAQISHHNKMLSLGYFPGTNKGAIEAAHIYDRRAIELRGDRAVLNFPRSYYK